jgi:hypothetical protein
MPESRNGSNFAERDTRGDRSRTVWSSGREDVPNRCTDRGRRDQLRDEAPVAYKDVKAVLRAQRDLAKVTRVLRTILNYQGV